VDEEATTPGRAPWDEGVARLYDLQRRLERAALRAALDLTAPGPGDALLDVGTGTGALLAELAARPGAPRSVVGTDASAAMLARVGPLPEGWRVARGDAARLPLADGAVDVATAAYLLHVLDPGARAAALAELRRVLRPGGRLACVTPLLPGLARAAGDALATRLPRALGGLRSLDPRAELAAAGFALLRARTVRRGYPSLCVLALRR
jgi:ubiquinone/menaquinone biosynthesis C-methylase UbiE